MKKLVSVCICTLVFLHTTLSAAQEVETKNQNELSQMQAELNDLRAQLLYLLSAQELKPTRTVASLRRDIEDFERLMPQELPEAPAPTPLLPFTMQGYLEFEAYNGRSWNESVSEFESTNEMTMAKVGFVFEKEFDSRLKTLVVIESDDDVFVVDEALLQWGNLSEANWLVSLGRGYLPFGDYNSIFVTDPYTKDLAETQGSLVNLTLGNENIFLESYLFSGALAKESEPQRFVHGGARLGGEWGGDSLSFKSSLSYVSSFGNLGTVAEVIADPLEENPAGAGLSVEAEFGGLILLAEYIGALDEFSQTQVAFGNRGATPSSTQYELGYRLSQLVPDMVLGLGYTTTEESLALELPKSKTSVGFALPLRPEVLLTVEHSEIEHYSEEDGGSGKTDSLSAIKVALEF